MLFHIGFDSNETCEGSLRICPVRHPTAVADSAPKIQPTQPINHCARSVPVSALPLFDDTSDEARAFVAARPCRVRTSPSQLRAIDPSATSEP
jgi:hypothetical protein